jgi:hypothetical protein
MLPQGLADQEKVKFIYNAANRLRVMCGHVREAAGRKRGEAPRAQLRTPGLPQTGLS